MSRIIILDSTPLGLFLQRRDYHQAEECPRWVARCIAAGDRIVVPEIVDYEVRRELLRLDKSRAITKLDAFNGAEPDRFLPLITPALRLAARLWATARKQGIPTADRFALDIDVILAAQVLSAGFDPAGLVVATGNVAHLSRLLPAELWSNI